LAGLRYMFVTAQDQRVGMQVVTVFSVLGIPYIVLMPVVGARPVAHGVGRATACCSRASGSADSCGALFLAAVGRWMRRGRCSRPLRSRTGVLLILFSLSRSVLVLVHRAAPRRDAR